MSDLLPQRFLFRFSLPARYLAQVPRAGKKELLSLPEECILPDLGPLDSARSFGQLRLAWNERGVAVALEVRGKKHRPQCDTTAPETADGLQVWIDTRATQNIHRASRFCHHFCLLPRGKEGHENQATAIQLPIARAKEPTPLCKPDDIPISATVSKDGYLLEAWLPAHVLNGYDPEAQPRLGFYYYLRDSELGEQFLTVNSEFPFAFDPSVWSVLELVRGTARAGGRKGNRRAV